MVHGFVALMGLGSEIQENMLRNLEEMRILDSKCESDIVTWVI